METITVGLGERQYPIQIGSERVADLGAAAREALPRCDRLLVVSNADIAALHAQPVLESLRAGGFEPALLELPEGEAKKTVATVERVWDHLITKGYTRQSALVALGGGVVGDITGFAAASYMRGIDCIQVPTSLLAMVDSSVGGKTGVNHPRAKNTIGAFWQPRLVFIDTAFLHTLPPEELRAGFAEVIKHGCIRNTAYFEFLETHLDAIFALDDAALARVVAGSCEIKADVVARDERESGLRTILNYGHTLGHAVETLAGYGQVRHGEAVAIGMVAAAGIAVEMGLCDPGVLNRTRSLIERSGLPTRFPSDLTTGAVLGKLKSDKKVQDGRVRFVLPTSLGEVTIRDDVPRETIAATIESTGVTLS